MIVSDLDDVLDTVGVPCVVVVDAVIVSVNVTSLVPVPIVTVTKRLLVFVFAAATATASTSRAIPTSRNIWVATGQYMQLLTY